MIASSSGPADVELGLLDGHPVRVGRGHREARALEADEDAGQDGPGLVARGGARYALHRVEQRRGLDLVQRHVDRREAREVLGGEHVDAAPSTTPTRSTRRRPRGGARWSTSFAGRRRTTSPRSFAGITIAPSPSTVAGTVVRSDSSMSVASSSSRPSRARSRIPPSTWTAPRAEAARDDEREPARQDVAIDERR